MYSYDGVISKWRPKSNCVNFFISYPVLGLFPKNTRGQAKKKEKKKKKIEQKETKKAKPILNFSFNEIKC